MVTRGASDEEHVIGMAETAKCLAMLERDLNQADAMLMEAGALAVRNRIRYHAIPTAQGILRYHEGRLDEAERLLGEARLLCKSAGDRISEFQANEYLAMIELERGNYEGVARRCRALLDIGGRLREGSEAPFAESLDKLCRYAMNDELAPLDEALQKLREVDAKHRLAYLLNRAAEVDLMRGRPDLATDRAREALDNASVLERRTEMLVASICLARAHQARGDQAEANRCRDAVAELAAGPVSRWAKERAASLTKAGEGATP
jgi:ATP/maltotriose-dependent transcriptional regulator MalT